MNEKIGKNNRDNGDNNNEYPDHATPQAEDVFSFMNYHLLSAYVYPLIPMMDFSSAIETLLSIVKKWK